MRNSLPVIIRNCGSPDAFKEACKKHSMDKFSSETYVKYDWTVL